MIFPKKYTLYLYKGADFDYTFTWKDKTGAPMNLTGYSARMHMRETLESAAPFLSFSTQSASIILGGMQGTIQLLANAAATGTVNAKSGVYDLELIAPSGYVVRFLEGKVNIIEEVTR